MGISHFLATLLGKGTRFLTQQESRILYTVSGSSAKQGVEKKTDLHNIPAYLSHNSISPLRDLSLSLMYHCFWILQPQVLPRKSVARTAMRMPPSWGGWNRRFRRTSKSSESLGRRAKGGWNRRSITVSSVNPFQILNIPVRNNRIIGTI